VTDRPIDPAAATPPLTSGARDRLGAGNRTWQTATVTSVEHHGPDSVTIGLDLPTAIAPRYLPGQH
jgi:hypothetical protein